MRIRVKLIFILLAIFPKLTFAEEISLQCIGSNSYLSWGAKDWKSYESNFEIFFDEKKSTLSWRGIDWCSSGTTTNDEVKINKKLISYKCNAINSFPEQIPAKVDGWFTLSRNTGKINWGAFMTSKKNDSESFSVAGEGSCNLSKQKF